MSLAFDRSEAEDDKECVGPRAYHHQEGKRFVRGGNASTDAVAGAFMDNSKE